MPHQLYYHVVWATRDRHPIITQPLAEYLNRMLRSIAQQERAVILELGMVSTHVHLLIRAHPMTTIPRMLQRLKGATSALATKELGLPPGRQLRWAQGYSIQTVSPSRVGEVREYVRHQARRHPSEAIEGWEPGESPVADPVEMSGDEDSLPCIERRRRL